MVRSRPPLWNLRIFMTNPNLVRKNARSLLQYDQFAHQFARYVNYYHGAGANLNAEVLAEIRGDPVAAASQAQYLRDSVDGDVWLSSVRETTSCIRV